MLEMCNLETFRYLTDIKAVNVCTYIQLISSFVIIFYEMQSFEACTVKLCVAMDATMVICDFW